MTAYYNEIDPFCAQWLRNLIVDGHIAPGVVDTRSIEDVRPSDLMGFTQCHFFAGIGIWSHSLRLAGWPDNRPVWTGSCPCQPFSQAGKGVGFDDKRHLWPHFQWLIQECCPTAILGEQVASKDAYPWIDLVHADMEALGYAFGCVPFTAAGVGSPQIRERMYWVAHSDSHSSSSRVPGSARQAPAIPGVDWTNECSTGQSGRAGGVIRSVQPDPADGFWGNADWLQCHDGKRRPIGPGIEPMVNEYPTRVGKISAYGNAIVAQQAKTFIETFMGV